MEGGQIKEVDVSESIIAEYFIIHANQILSLKVAFFEKGKIGDTYEIRAVPFSEENFTEEQFHAAMKLLDIAEKIKKDTQYAYKVANRIKEKMKI